MAVCARCGTLLQVIAVSQAAPTAPPPRHSEASVVRRLEELGIGRPSTYAAIVTVLQEQQYVALLGGRFVPLERGRVVTAFLERFFGPRVRNGSGTVPSQARQTLPLRRRSG